MSWQIHVTEQARKQLKRLPRKDTKRIEGAVDVMASNPFAGDIEKLQGWESVWRRRVGAYRILYELSTEKKLIYIIDIRRRTSKTY